MNITFVTSSAGTGGAEKMLYFLASSLKDRGHNVCVLNLDLTKDYDMSQRYDVRTVNLEGDYRGPFLTNYDWIRFVRREAKKNKAEVLIGFLEHGNFCVSVAGKLLHIPSIIAERGDPFTTFKHISKTVKIKLSCINHADGAVFQTEGASRFYSRHLQRNCAIIPNPIFLEGNIPQIDYSSRPKTVVMLGRLDNKQKRLDIAVESFALFHKRHPDYTLIVYGVGPDKDFMQNIIEEKGLSGVVEFRGKTTKALESLSKEGIFLISSDYEGISNSLLEAMAVGLPVVSTDHSPGGARMLIQDHVNGLLAPVADVSALASALSEFADDKALAEQCGNNAKSILDRFTPERAISLWESYICRIISNY